MNEAGKPARPTAEESKVVEAELVAELEALEAEAAAVVEDAELEGEDEER